MRRLNARGPRIAGLLALALGVVALLAMSGVATAQDHHGDGHGHGRHHQHHHHRFIGQTGTVSAFDATTGKLTLALANGESVTGLVTSDTRIDCEGFDDRGVDRRDHGGSGSGGGGNGGHFEPGDDNGGQNEPGDDNGGEVAGAPQGTVPPGQSCTTDSLVPGAMVDQAELRLEGGAATFTEIELGEGESESEGGSTNS